MKLARLLCAIALLACAATMAEPSVAAECSPSPGPDSVPTLVAKNARSWKLLRIWERAPSVSVEAAEAEVARIGGSRLLLEIDRTAVRNRVLDGLRADTIRVLRDARILWAHPPARRPATKRQSFSRMLMAFAHCEYSRYADVS
jgi:hypothetical protein